MTIVRKALLLILLYLPHKWFVLFSLGEHLPGSLDRMSMAASQGCQEGAILNAGRCSISTLLLCGAQYIEQME
jgi:hypothetical protein